MNKFILPLLFLYSISLSEVEIVNQKSSIKNTKRTPANINYSTNKAPKQIKKEEVKKRLNRTKKIYLEMAKYPPNSYPIDHKKTGDILQAKYQTQTEKLWSDESPKYQLQIWSPKYYYDETDKSIVLNYSVTTPSRLEITLEKKKINKAIKGSGLIRIPLNDLEFGDHLLKISSFGSQQKEVIHTTRVITYQERMYQYNGITQDKVSNQGDLNFTVDFDIYHKGHYLLEATLYNENDEIIALSEKTYLLDTGEQQIDLSFYGKILFQQKSEGRYKIKFMTLTKVDENLNLKRSSLIRADYTSKHYLYDQFHDNDFNDEVQLAKAMQIP